VNTARLRRLIAKITILKVALVLSLAVAFTSPTLAQGPIKITDTNRETQSVHTQFKSRVGALQSGCRLAEYFVLNKELNDASTTLTQRVTFFTDTMSTQSNAEKRRRFTIIADIQRAQRAIAEYEARNKKACHPRYISDAIQDDLDACKLVDAEEKLDKLRGIQRQFNLIRRQINAARKANRSSEFLNSIDVTTLGIWAVNSPPFFQRSEQAVKAYRERAKATPNGGDACTDGETIELDDLSGGPSEDVEMADVNEEPVAQLEGIEVNPCERINGRLDPMNAQTCQAWAPILGTWVNREYGGSIVFRLRSDRTVSAYVGTANKRMEHYGYTNGMEILRSYHLAGQNGGTWLVWAQGGEEFSAKMPDREPGQQFSEASWNQTRATIFINKNSPNAIGLPGQLRWRISNGKAWVRQ